MNFSRILAITGRIILQFTHDHRSLALIFIAPLLIMTLLGYILRAQEDTAIKVAVVNEDKPAAGATSLAAPIIDSLNANTGLAITTMSRSDAEQAVKEGTQRVALVFGPDFSQQLSAKHQASLEAIVEGSNPGEAASALGGVGQTIASSSIQLVKQLLPPQFSSALPPGTPIQLNTTRLYGSADLKTVDFFAPMFIAYIGFFLIFLLTSVSFLRERTQGTMERLAASPTTRLEMVLGYMFGFGFFAMLQAVVLLLFTVFVLQVKYAGNLLSILVVTLALVLGAVNMGIWLSAFARNELQAIQFIPIVIIPQVLLSGLLWPVAEMPTWLQVIARIMPLTYAVDALTNIMIRGQSLASTWLPLLVLLLFAALVAGLAATTVRREVA